MNVLEFAVICLASAKIARCMLVENGPANAFGKVRDVVGADEPEIKVGSLANLFNCPWCMTTWTTAALFIAYGLNQEATITVATAVAAMGVAGYIAQQVT